MISEHGAFKPFKAILTFVRYTSTAILSQVHLNYDEEKIGSGGGDDMAMEVGKGEVEVAKEARGGVARAEVDPRLISPP
ncbi:hypothetical protein IGI04_018866 [Brassica rapa subsp. trilocularis]|uniref:Uncharacterized protein n=1 Tax=Brassica rapa subsp. trilocularis TaxID=1813537 RepID=A0ABQ7ME62_BRACM|nr:hypothetical protein IGI04_018866 [Brassica rapa subsp. trilocularis]